MIVAVLIAAFLNKNIKLVKINRTHKFGQAFAEL